MRTYWDLSEKERAALSSEDVQKYLDAELMTQGVLKVEAPAYEEEPAAGLPPGHRVFRVGVLDRSSRWAPKQVLNVGFEEEEQLKAFLALRPLVIGTEYFEGENREFTTKLTPNEEPEIQIVEVRTREELERCRGALSKLTAVREANRKKKEAFEAATKKEKEALAGLWEDWFRCCELAGRIAKVRETYDSYVGIAGGDQETAFKFLRKAFGDDEIIAAFEWFGLDAPGAFHIVRDRIEVVRSEGPEAF